MSEKLVAELNAKDPLAVKFLVGEYHFMKKNFDRAREIFFELHEGNKLDPALHNAARNYLILADRLIRARTMEQTEFTIEFKFTEANGRKYHYTIDKANFSSKVNELGMLLEIVDFYLKKQKKSGVVDAEHNH